jgi:hypothetical protein
VDPLEQTVRKLNHAISRGLYAGAAALLEEFRCSLAGRLADGSLSGTEREALLRECGGFLEQALRTVQAARAHDAAQLRVLAASSPYGRSSQPPRHTFRLEAY